MKLKRLAIAYPSGNTTAVVFDQLLEMQDRQGFNCKITQSWKSQKPQEPGVEQCCFVTKPRNSDAVVRVEMFGGEFCGNATRSVIWLITKGENYEGLIEVSGVPAPLSFSVNEGEVTLQMPLPQESGLTESVAEGTLVHLDGITHLVVMNSTTTPSPHFSQTLEKFERSIHAIFIANRSRLIDLIMASSAFSMHLTQHLARLFQEFVRSAG